MVWLAKGVTFALFVLGLAMTSQNSALAKGDDKGELHLLVVSVCPPYREQIPVEVCRNSAKQVAESFKDNLPIEAKNIITLTDEAATGAHFMQTLDRLRSVTTASDRVIIYLQLHGDAFHVWAKYYQPNPVVQSINENFVKPNEDVLVFWTKDEPSVPAIAIAQRDWLTAGELIEAMDAVDAKVSLILDSCSSGLFFRALTQKALATDNIDYILTSAGAEQSSNFDASLRVSLFARELSESIALPTVRTFGEAVEQARITTVLNATAYCSKAIVSPNDYRMMFPLLTIPSAKTADGKVAPPLWFCAQVPSVVDLSGVTSAIAVQ